MRCYICDKSLNEPAFNRDYQTWEPCPECLEAIQDTLSAFRDRPSIAEDEYGQLPLPLTISLDNLP